MKKLLVLVTILCVTFMCFTACTAKTPDAEQSIENTAEPTNNGGENEDRGENDEEDSTPNPPPPLALYFDSFEAIEELRGMMAQDDNIVKEYLADKGYDMNAELHSKEDIAALFRSIDNLEMLHIEAASGYTPAGVIYYISYRYIMSTYSNENEMIRFVCYTDTENLSTNPDDSNKGDAELSAVENLTLSNKSIPLYKIDDSDSLYALSGKLVTSNSRITILLTDQAGKGLDCKKIEENLVVLTFRELTEQKR